MLLADTCVLIFQEGLVPECKAWCLPLLFIAHLAYGGWLVGLLTFEFVRWITYVLLVVDILHD